MINLNDDIIGFDDASRFDNHHSSGKIWHKKGVKNIIIKSLGKKESINVIGFQPLNGVPVLSCPERSNRATFSIHQFDVRIPNMENEKVANKLYKFIKCEELNEEFIKNELKEDMPNNNELNKQISDATNKPYETQTALNKRINRIFNKINVKSKIVVDIQEQVIYNWMEENQWIKDELKKEKRIVMVLDNHSANISNLAKDVAKFLNIKLIHLPRYSPKLNPIEQVWRAMKKKISSIDFETIESLLAKVKYYYSEYVEEKTFTDKWIKKFISKS
jgi:transposase